MFQTEVYRIMSRKMTVTAMLGVLLLVLYYGVGITVWGEGVLDGGKVYAREEAIAMDKEIAAEFTGPLTDDIIRRIWDIYGAPLGEEARRGTYDVMEIRAEQGSQENFCNIFVTRRFAEKIQSEEGTISYVLPEDLSQNEFLQGDYYFCYAGNGWSMYWDIFVVAYILVCLVVAVALSPMFAEDYACGTADIILPTVCGRQRLWWVRTGVGCCFASVYYWLVCGSIFIEQTMFYGTEGLNISCAMVNIPFFFLKNMEPAWKGLIIVYLAGWFSILVLTVTVQCISAGSKQSFGALIRVLLAFLGPFAAMRILLDSLPMGKINAFLHYLCYSTPLCFPGTFAEAPDKDKLFLWGIALIMGVALGALGNHSYCRHQVKTASTTLR